MARKTREEIEAKKAETKRIVDIFSSDTMPIDKWAEYISANAETDKQKRHYRSCAKKALTLKKMMDYITTHDNTEEAKRAFYAGSWGTQYEKVDVNTKNGRVRREFVYLDKAKKIKKPVKDENGNDVKEQALVYAVDYFCSTYLDGLLKLEEAEKEKAFDALEAWK